MVLGCSPECLCCLEHAQDFTIIKGWGMMNTAKIGINWTTFNIAIETSLWCAILLLFACKLSQRGNYPCVDKREFAPIFPAATVKLLFH